MCPVVHQIFYEQAHKHTHNCKNLPFAFHLQATTSKLKKGACFSLNAVIYFMHLRGCWWPSEAFEEQSLLETLDFCFLLWMDLVKGCLNTRLVPLLVSWIKMCDSLGTGAGFFTLIGRWSVISAGLSTCGSEGGGDGSASLLLSCTFPLFNSILGIILSSAGSLSFWRPLRFAAEWWDGSGGREQGLLMV